MPRKRELTWQAGSNGRGGRWRKKYKGQSFYFPGGNGKTDQAAYDRAVELWKQKKEEIDAEVVKPHEADYRTAIIEWNAVLNWSTQHGDSAHAELARRKVKELQSRLVSNTPNPLGHGDRLHDQFEVSPDMLAGIAGTALGEGQATGDPTVARGAIVTPDPTIADEFAMTRQKVNGRVWQDRVESQLTLQRESQAETVEGNFQRFKAQKQAEAAVGEISAGRYANLMLHVEALVEFVGGVNPVGVLNERTMRDYRSDLLNRVGTKEIGSTYAKDHLDSAKQFVRWLWRERTLDDLPRIFDDQKFNISASSKEIKTFETDEIKQLLTAATGPMRLHILLTLNAALTQKDLSDLRPDEVQWKKGTIRRKRSKTGENANVPEVTYTLWPETLQLLRLHRSDHPEQLLLNERGGPLKVERLRPDGKLYKVDNVQRNFGRLCRKLKITGRSFTSLKKTSATLLRGQKKYHGVVDYFLGHAPRKMSDKHYAGGPDALLAKALKWLAKELQISKCLADASHE